MNFTNFSEKIYETGVASDYDGKSEFNYSFDRTNESIFKEIDELEIDAASVFWKYPPGLLYFGATCLIVFAVFGVTVNLFSILALSLSRRLRNATTVFIVNICVADMLCCGISAPLFAILFIQKEWNYGKFLCYLLPLISYSGGQVSVFFGMAITVNRYVLIIHRDKYLAVYTKRNIAIMIAFMWTVALLILFPALIGVWGKLGYDPRIGTCSLLNVNGQSPKMLWFIIMIGCILIFPVLYLKIYFFVKKSSENVLRNKRDFRVLSYVLVIYAVFPLCYIPLSLVKMLHKEEKLYFFNVLFYVIIYFTNAANPVVYTVLSKEYRRVHKEFFSKIFLRNKSFKTNPDSVRSTSV